jgi:uncharacterized membrane protein
MMDAPQEIPQPENLQLKNLHRHCLILYALDSVSAVLQVPNDALMMGLSLVTLAIAGHMSRKKKEAAQGTPYASHLQWLYRTGWIASCIAIPVNIGLSGALIWAFTDIGSLAHAMDGDPETMINSLQAYADANMTKVDIFSMIGATPPTLWWLHRCWRGYILLKADKPVDNVTSWL